MMTGTLSIIQPKRPTGPGWRRATWWRCPPQLAELGYPVEPWEHPASGLFALSAVEVAHDPGQPDLGPEYHLSITLNGGRCTAADALFVLAAFGLSDATEDNHVPGGRARNFWRPVADKLSGHICHCQDEEPAMREDKGDYVWRGVTR
ncbi:hypothetical protein [Azohydromonas aeria]|uniref:hypothetical protein n=1 Tax=Azohydromonas aeria TaxID=2590212 RepID=UPI0018DEF5CC|nr:hypothetical protein [Azohydromonas aeria]